MFSKLKKYVEDEFALMISGGRTLMATTADKDDLWEAYIGSFSTAERQEHDCRACQAFIQRVGGVVVIGAENAPVLSLWCGAAGLIPPSYVDNVRALDAVVRGATVSGVFFSDPKTSMRSGNWDGKRELTWEHLYVDLPHDVIDSDGRAATRASKINDLRHVLERGLSEITYDALTTVQDLIAQNSLYRGAEHMHALRDFELIKHDAENLTGRDLTNYCWRVSAASGANARVIGLRNTAVGTLLLALSAREDLERSVAAYEAMVAPANYQRPTALVTPRMVEKAKERLGELGLLGALDRRVLDTRDLTAAHAAFLYRPTRSTLDAFGALADDVPVDTAKLGRVDEITLERFIADVVPTAHTISVLPEGQHMSNMVTLTGPVDPDSAPLFKWENSFGWSYTGGMADSLSERVKKVGGRVDKVWMRVSLGWSNHDDLDLHLSQGQQGMHVYFGNRLCHVTGAQLDVDMNAATASCSDTPVENIYVPRQLPQGIYRISVAQFQPRDSARKGYELELHVGQQTRYFSSTSSPRRNHSHDITITVTSDGEVLVNEFNPAMVLSTAGCATRWGISTGRWHKVRAITKSPNHWTRPVGNEHWFFLLMGCATDETTRPFYNEFLVPELASERKVLEALADKITVAPAEGQELSGLGFSTTQRAHIYAKVDGSFSRVLKVLI
jgi:hypothetical protein